jgi:hypothetical protein
VSSSGPDLQTYVRQSLSEFFLSPWSSRCPSQVCLNAQVVEHRLLGVHGSPSREVSSELLHPFSRTQPNGSRESLELVTS